MGTNRNTSQRRLRRLSPKISRDYCFSKKQTKIIRQRDQKSIRTRLQKRTLEFSSFSSPNQDSRSSSRRPLGRLRRIRRNNFRSSWNLIIFAHDSRKYSTSSSPRYWNQERRIPHYPSTILPNHR